MADLLAGWFIHQTTVEAYSGSAAEGDVYADGAALTGFVDDSSKLIRTPDGEQVVSSARVFYPAGSSVPLRSKVTLPVLFGGRTSRVIAVSVHDAGAGFPNHVEVALA